MFSHAQKQLKKLVAPQGNVLQRKCYKCRKKATLQRHATDSAPEVAPSIVHEVLQSQGQPLDQEIRTFMEPHFGHDFSRVRVHNDPKAAESARAINALAYTVGRHIIFGTGQYTSGDAKKNGLIAHELAHVVQTGGAPVPPGPIKIASPNSTNEVLANAATWGVSSPQHVNGPVRLYRGVSLDEYGRFKDPNKSPPDDRVAFWAAEAIKGKRAFLNDNRLSPEQREKLAQKIQEAEIALANYRRYEMHHGGGRGRGPGPMVGIATPHPGAVLLTLAMALGGWYVLSTPMRDPSLEKPAYLQALENALLQVEEATRTKIPPIMIGPDLSKGTVDIVPIPKVDPIPKKPKERREPCKYSLPISWPTYLPELLFSGEIGRGLMRVSKGDREWEGTDRGKDQRKLRDKIDLARTMLGPPPTPCFEDDVEENDLYDAHHIHPLYLNGEEAEWNLCALNRDRHRKGHSMLNNQTEHLEEYIQCGIFTPFLDQHPFGQTYHIVRE